MNTLHGVRVGCYIVTNPAGFKAVMDFKTRNQDKQYSDARGCTLTHPSSVIPVAAAVQLDSGVTVSLPKPARHHDIIHAVSGVESLGGYTQGFLTNTGVFVDRITAATLALEAGLITKLETPPKLFTEDLW